MCMEFYGRIHAEGGREDLDSTDRFAKIRKIRLRNYERANVVEVLGIGLVDKRVQHPVIFIFASDIAGLP